MTSFDPTRVRVYYDFASTLCYVTHKVISTVESEIADLGIELEWRPVDLTMAAPWDRGDSFSDEVREAIRNTAMELGVDVVMPDPWLDSRPASQIALQIQNLEDEQRWRSAVFETFFEHKTPYLTPSLVQLACELTDSDAMTVGGDDYGLVEETSEEAIALGITGVPTFLLHHWIFGGVHEPQAMVALLAQLVEQYHDQGAATVN